MNFLIEDIARFSVLVPVVFFIFFKPKDKKLQVLFYFLLFVILHQIIYNSLIKRESPHLILFNSFYTPIELLFTSFFIRPSLKSTINKNFIIVGISIFFICWAPLLLLAKTHDYVSYIRAFAYSLILVFSLLYFYEQMRYPQTLFIYSQQSFWSIAGILLFAAGTFFVFLFDQFSIDVEGFLQQYVYIHALLFIIRNFLFSIAMIIKPEKTPLADNPISLV